MSYYLAYHSWQHLCNWRDYEARLRTLANRIQDSLGDFNGGGGGGDEDDVEGGGSPRAGDAVDGGGVRGSTEDLETLVRAMEAPYIFLVSRLVDTHPQLVRRLFARQAVLKAREAAAEELRGRWDSAAALAGGDGGGVAGDSATAAAAAAEPLGPGNYLRNGQLSVAYLSGLPAGHVTYDLVGSMLRFHADPYLRVYCTGAPDARPPRTCRAPSTHLPRALHAPAARPPRTCRAPSTHLPCALHAPAVRPPRPALAPSTPRHAPPTAVTALIVRCQRALARHHQICRRRGSAAPTPLTLGPHSGRALLTLGPRLIRGSS